MTIVSILKDFSEAVISIVFVIKVDKCSGLIKCITLYGKRLILTWIYQYYDT